MEWQLLKYRLYYPFSRKQKAAMAGRVPMTKDLFWSCLDTAYCRLDTKNLKMLLRTYPQYMQEYREAAEREMADPNSPRRKKDEEEWARLRARLVEYYGEEYVRENFAD